MIGLRKSGGEMSIFVDITDQYICNNDDEEERILLIPMYYESDSYDNDCKNIKYKYTTNVCRSCL